MVQADRRAVMTIRRVKIDRDNQNERPEESPLVVVVEKKVELRRKLARLQKDYKAADRLKQHLANDIEVLEGRLAKASRK